MITSTVRSASIQLCDDERKRQMTLTRVKPVLTPLAVNHLIQGANVLRGPAGLLSTANHRVTETLQEQ